MFFISTICILFSLILLFLLLSSFIYFKIHTHCSIVNNEKLKTSFLLMRVLAIAIIDGSANCSVIIGCDELFLCYRLHNPVSGDQSLGIFFQNAFKCLFLCALRRSVFILSILFMQPQELTFVSLSLRSLVFAPFSQCYLQLGKRKHYFCFFLRWYENTSCIL